jgi:CheY-like chemotaxis protein
MGPSAIAKTLKDRTPPRLWNRKEFRRRFPPGQGKILGPTIRAGRLTELIERYFTAYAVRMSALQSGCLAYLTKPFSAKSLIEPLKRASAEPI